MNQLPDLLLSEKNPIPCAGKVAQDTKYLAIIAWNSKYLIMGQAEGRRDAINRVCTENSHLPDACATFV